VSDPEFIEAGLPIGQLVAARAAKRHVIQSRPGDAELLSVVPIARDPELGHQLWAQSTTLLTAADAATSDELNF